MAGFENYSQEIREIEQEIERKGIALGINWDDDAQVRSLARDALDHATGDMKISTTDPVDTRLMAKLDLFGLAGIMLRTPQEQAGRLLAELPEHQSDVVLLALATGLRQSNVLKLEWSQINLEKRHAWIHAAQSKNRRPIAIALNEAAHAVLVRQIGKHPERVFTFNGKPLNSANTRAWKRALKRAEIDDFRWHDLRHTGATWQRQAGTPTHELQRLGGWRTGAMVDRYAHLAPDHLAVAASRLDSVLIGYDLAT